MMTRFIIAVFILLCLVQSVASQQLTQDQEKRIEIGINVIKLGCGTQSSNKKAEISGKGDISLTLKKLPGADVASLITYSTEEAQGLAIALQKEINSDTTKLSQFQIECMKPYIKRVFDLVLPDATPSQQIDAKGPTPLSNLSADQSSSEREFVISGGQSVFLTSKKIIFSAVGNPYGGRSDLFAARLEGVEETFAIGSPKEFRAGQSTCSVTLLEIVKSNTGKFYLRC